MNEEACAIFSRIPSDYFAMKKVGRGRSYLPPSFLSLICVYMLTQAPI
jgi:hypothetical protein